MAGNKPTYSAIFKNYMFKLGITQERMGILLAKNENRSKPYVKGNIEFYLKKTNSQWKIDDLEKWCKVLNLNLGKVLSVCN